MFDKIFKKLNNFNFQEPENTVCFVCDHVLNNERPILFVSHDTEDSNWQFLCGQDDHSDENIRIISLRQVVDLDSSVNDLWEMPLGICAEREKVGNGWQPFKMKE